jgi:alpha-beta hydrolase superfamily lysophospholipase
VSTPDAVRESFYSAGTPESDVKRFAAKLGEEYIGRVSVEAATLRRPKPQRVTAPVLVLGAEDDACFSQREVEETARAYGTSAEFFPGMGHNMMLEPGWVSVAERIDEWLRSRGLRDDREDRVLT